MKIIIPQQVTDSVNEFKRKDVKDVAYKIYSALKRLDERKNTTTGWFDAPSSYLKSINVRYYKIIDKFLEDGIIKYYSRPTTDPQDIFNSIDKKYYNKSLGFCMKYKFLIDTEIGIEYDFDVENPNKMRWYEIIKSSLISLGYEPKIGRDTFGRRVHHPAIYDHKSNLTDKGFSIIDAKCSQPRLLYLIMKEKGIYDKIYYDIFESNDDFYLYLIEKLEVKTRQEAKDLFMFWINADGYVPNTGIFQLFPNTSNFIKSLKTRSYKDASAFLQRKEAKIWIDDLLENIPVNFALPIHDALLVRTIDAREILSYCRDKYPQIEFEVKEL
jgi:hypothetical protein